MVLVWTLFWRNSVHLSLSEVFHFYTNYSYEPYHSCWSWHHTWHLARDSSTLTRNLRKSSYLSVSLGYSFCLMLSSSGISSPECQTTPSISDSTEQSPSLSWLIRKTCNVKKWKPSEIIFTLVKIIKVLTAVEFASSAISLCSWMHDWWA